ncbi:MAG TPA: DUF1176 domain-containing protein [Erwinia persicina]|uniref:DUF1176 domain-containing protein n=1 Tax=Erwinia persicina TaxID=55211 RepID=UPI000E4D39B0|nr:DUF1176 domain-containing protein [Erwinia persicina]AXU96816.1 hypothetical protein CI789_17325 [Erwinia persicina]HBQ81023.1 DUF1176 domain-containing protein [Erwinia persicina]
MNNNKLVMAFMLMGLSTGVQADEWVNAPVQKVFKNWQVTCNNVNDCDVRNTDKTLRIILKRQAGAEAQPSLSFQQWAALKADGIWLDGQAWSSDIQIATPQSSDEHVVGSSDKLAVIQAWVTQAKNAETIAFSAGPESASLEGLTAALLLVDERQGRLDNQTALLKVGDKPSSAVLPRPAPVALNFPVPAVVPLTDPAALVDGAIAANGKLLKQLQCPQDEDTRARSYAEPLNNTQALVMVNCGPGDFKTLNVVFISERDNPKDTRRLTLPLPLNGTDGKPMQETMFAQGGYDSAVGHLYFSDRGNEAAECGNNGGWIYDGKTFHLARFKNQPGCNGGQPADWPSVWVTEGKE